MMEVGVSTLSPERCAVVSKVRPRPLARLGERTFNRTMRHLGRFVKVGRTILITLTGKAEQEAISTQGAFSPHGSKSMWS